MSYSKFRKKVELQKESNLYRKPIAIDFSDGKYIISGNKKLLNFSSNDYLGLGSSREVADLVSKNFSKYSSSASSSRMVTGNFSIINEAEKKYASYFGFQDCLFFPSGYQANLAIITTLFGSDDIAFYDKHIHASSVMGMKASGGNFIGYNHQSISHLKKRIEKNLKSEEKPGLISESLFSMDGDLLNMKALSDIKNEYDMLTIIDEAHTLGVMGEKGKGISSGVSDIMLGTYGKAFGLFGAFVLMPSVIKEYFLNFSSPFIYTTTLPEAQAASVMDILDIVYHSDDKRERVKNNSALLKDHLKNENFKVSGDAHIISIEIGDEKKAMDVSTKLMDEGIYLFVARYPTVPLNRAILRVSISAHHDKSDILKLVQGLIGTY